MLKPQSTVEYRNPIYEFFYGDRYQGDEEPVTGHWFRCNYHCRRLYCYQ